MKQSKLMLPLLIVVFFSCSKSNVNLKSSVSSAGDESSMSEEFSFNKGLIAYYPFKGNLKDSSGNHYDASYLGTKSFTKDHNGSKHSALALGSVRVTATNFFDFQYTDSFSIAMWVKINTNNSGGRLLSNECPEGTRGHHPAA